MTDEDLMARIKFVVDNLSFKIGDLTLMYEHKQVDPDDFCKEVSCIKSDFVESIMDLIREHDEWFESTSNLKWNDRYWGKVSCRNYTDAVIDRLNIDNGNAYRTEEECKEAYERKLAEVRLCKTSDFEPIFESEYGGWIVYFDYENRMLDCAKVFSCDRGELVHYATEEDAKRSIKENRADWLAYFGIKEWK